MIYNMPQYNTFYPRAEIFGQRLEHMQHSNPKRYAQGKTLQFARDIGRGAGSMLGGAILYKYGTSTKPQLAQRSYTKTTVRRRRPYRPVKKCCRYRYGRKVCSPEFCEKRRRKYYWY